jgi:hypothetical protein
MAELPSSRHHTGARIPTPHTISIAILLQLAILGRSHMKKNEFSDEEEEEEKENENHLDRIRRKECVDSIKATGIGHLLTPTFRKKLLLFLIDEITTLKRRKMESGKISFTSSSSSSSSFSSNFTPSATQHLLHTPMYYEPTLPQLIEILNPTNNTVLSNVLGGGSIGSRNNNGNNNGGLGEGGNGVIQYLLHRLKRSLASPDDLDNLLLSFKELLGDPRHPRAPPEEDDDDDDYEPEEDPGALSDVDESVHCRSSSSVPGGVPRYVERKSIVGVFLRRLNLKSSRMLFDGLSKLYDDMLCYNNKEMYVKMTRNIVS